MSVRDRRSGLTGLQPGAEEMSERIMRKFEIARANPDFLK